MPRFLLSVQGRIRGGGGRWGQMHKTFVVQSFFALHLILGVKLHICGRNDHFFGLQIRFLTL